MRRLAAFAVFLCLTACSASTVVRTSDSRPTLAFADAPEGAIVFVDGQRIGEASLYDGQLNVLVVEPGTHLVTVKDKDGALLLERKVYVESELKTLKVR